MRCVCGEDDIERKIRTMHIRHEDIIIRIHNTPVDHCYHCDTTVINGAVVKRMFELTKESFDRGDDEISYEGSR